VSLGAQGPPRLDPPDEVVLRRLSGLLLAAALAVEVEDPDDLSQHPLAEEAFRWLRHRSRSERRRRSRPHGISKD
jgi:hypothetical protein